MFLEHSRTPDLEMEKTLTGLFDKANTVYEEMDKSGQADALFKASAARDVDHKPSIGSNCDFDNVAHENGASGPFIARRSSGQKRHSLTW